MTSNRVALYDVGRLSLTGRHIAAAKLLPNAGFPCAHSCRVSSTSTTPSEMAKNACTMVKLTPSATKPLFESMSLSVINRFVYPEKPLIMKPEVLVIICLGKGNQILAIRDCQKTKNKKKQRRCLTPKGIFCWARCLRD